MRLLRSSILLSMHPGWLTDSIYKAISGEDVRRATVEATVSDDSNPV